MYHSKQHPSTLEIPEGMNRLQDQQAQTIQGGKRREGAFINRALYGLLAGMIFPGGFIVAFL